MNYPLAAYICCKGVCGLYDIVMNDRKVGYTEVSKEGLYYRFFCSCIPPEKGMHRVKVSDSSATRDLGICVPEDGRFTLTARVPIKYLKENELSFTLCGEMETSVPVPVAAEKPFSHLEELETAHLHSTNGQQEIIIKQAQVPQDSDLSQGSQDISQQF